MAPARYIFSVLSLKAVYPHSDIDMAVTGIPPEKFFHAMGEAHTILMRPLDLIDLDDGSLFSDYLKKEGLLIDVNSIT